MLKDRGIATRSVVAASVVLCVCAALALVLALGVFNGSSPPRPGSAHTSPVSVPLQNAPVQPTSGPAPAPLTAASDLPNGTYIDTANNFTMTLQWLPSEMWGGSIYESSTHSLLRQYTAGAGQAGAFTLTTSAGQHTTGSYAAQTFTIENCGQVIPGVAAQVQSCTFQKQ